MNISIGMWAMTWEILLTVYTLGTVILIITVFFKEDPPFLLNAFIILQGILSYMAIIGWLLLSIWRP